MTQGMTQAASLYLTIPHYTSPTAGGAQGADPGVGNLLGHGERSLGRPRTLLEAGTLTFPSPHHSAPPHLHPHLTLILTLTLTPMLPRSHTLKDESYSERGRQWRRTVFMHDDWVTHRAPQTTPQPSAH